MKLILLTLLTMNCFAFQTFKTFDGKELKGSSKAYLIVNIATRCGYTGQLGGLEKLYQKYKSQGLEIIGIPSNEFGGQSPESNAGIGSFCRKEYGVTFPILKKASVLSRTKDGDPKNELISRLVKESGKAEITWNFEKFLLDANGKLIKRFPSSTKPLANDLAQKIISAL